MGVPHLQVLSLVTNMVIAQIAKTMGKINRW